MLQRETQVFPTPPSADAEGVRAALVTNSGTWEGTQGAPSQIANSLIVHVFVGVRHDHMSYAHHFW